MTMSDINLYHSSYNVRAELLLAAMFAIILGPCVVVTSDYFLLIHIRSQKQLAHVSFGIQAFYCFEMKSEMTDRKKSPDPTNSFLV